MDMKVKQKNLLGHLKQELEEWAYNNKNGPLWCKYIHESEPFVWTSSFFHVLFIFLHLNSFGLSIVSVHLLVLLF